MKTQNEKTFNCTAITGKGNFDVEITVWESFSDGKEYFVTKSWEQKVKIFIDGEEYSGKINLRGGGILKSHEVAKKYGIKRPAQMKCDYSDVVDYIKKTEWARIKEDAKLQEEDNRREELNDL